MGWAAVELCYLANLPSGKVMGLSSRTSFKKEKRLQFPHSWTFLVTLPFNQDINQIIALVPKRWNFTFNVKHLIVFGQI